MPTSSRGCSGSGATVRYVASTAAIRAAVPATRAATVAAWGAVERIEPAAQAMTARDGGRETDKEERAPRDRAPRRRGGRLRGRSRAHAADTARASDQVTGVGTKLCAL